MSLSAKFIFFQGKQLGGSIVDIKLEHDRSLFFWLRPRQHEYVCSRHCTTMLVYVGLGMFRSWNGWNFKLWFQFFVFFSNFSFNLCSSDPCFSCSFRPPTPQTDICNHVAVLDGGLSTTSNTFDISFYKGLASMTLLTTQVSINSLFLQRVSMIRPLGTLCKRNFQDLRGFCWPRRSNEENVEMIIKEDCIRLSMSRIRSPKLQRTTWFVHLKQGTYLQPQHRHVFVDHCARPNLLKWSTSSPLCFSMLWLWCKCQNQHHYEKIQQGELPSLKLYVSPKYSKLTHDMLFNVCFFNIIYIYTYLFWVRMLCIYVSICL